MGYFDRKQGACEGKYAYVSAGDAYKLLRKYRPGQRAKKGRVVYRCPFCHCYHTGTEFAGDRR